MAKHPNHICRFNDGEQSCECYDKGFNDGREILRDLPALLKDAKVDEDQRVYILGMLLDGET